MQIQMLVVVDFEIDLLSLMESSSSSSLVVVVEQCTNCDIAINNFLSASKAALVGKKVENTTRKTKKKQMQMLGLRHS